MYTKHRNNKNGIVWRCDNRSECSSMITISHNRQRIAKEPTTYVNHDPDWGRVEAKECIEAMKDRARSSRETSSIIQQGVIRTSSEANVMLPKKETIRRTFRSIRRENLPEEPANIEVIEDIPEIYKKTLDGQRWLLHYNCEDENKIIIFATDRHLRFLFNSRFWIMDGTFRSTPTVAYLEFGSRGGPASPTCSKGTIY